MEEWSILLQEAELSDAWRGFKTFAGLDTHEAIYGLLEKAKAAGFEKILKRLGDWWLAIPKVHKKSLLEGKAVELNKSIVGIGGKIFT